MSTLSTWQQIKALLEAGHQQTAFNLFFSALGDAYSAGVSDTEYDYNQAQEERD